MEETQKPLIERLSFEEDRLYLDGKLLYTTPEIAGTRHTSVVGAYGDWLIDIGTGDCCNGYFQRLVTRGTEKKFGLNFIMPVDFIVFDIIPVHDIETETKVDKENIRGQSVLVTGHGCYGEGVRILGVGPAGIKKIFSGEEYYKLAPKYSERPVPRFNVVEGKIYLDMSGIARRFSPERDPRKPALLHDRTDTEYIVGSNSMDLTQRLADAGVDIAETLKLTQDYQRIHRR